MPTADLPSSRSTSRRAIRIIGAGEVDGKVRRIAPTVEPNSQLGQVFIGITTNRRLLVNSSGRALIKTGQSCGVAVPLTAVLYSARPAPWCRWCGAQRIETKRVEIGLMSGGQIEIRDGLNEGDIVVARAGALLREGDPVRPVTAAAKRGSRAADVVASCRHSGGGSPLPLAGEGWGGGCRSRLSIGCPHAPTPAAQ